MNQFTFGVYLFIGAMVSGVVFVTTYVVALNIGLLYVYGYSNPWWVDFALSAFGPLCVLMIFVSMWLMYEKTVVVAS